MPTDPYYTAPRAEPVRLQAGENKSGIQVGFPIASIAINNYGEYFAFIEPSNRPGFWIAPYQTGFIASLYPPATYISVTQSITGPSGTSGVISSGGAGTMDIQIYDAPLSPQVGIIQEPSAQYESAFINLFAQLDQTGVIVAPLPGQNLIIRRLAFTLPAGWTQEMLITALASWDEVPPPSFPLQPFSWSQAITPESVYNTDTFEINSAIIHNGSTLQLGVSTLNDPYYLNAGITLLIQGEVQFYRVNA